MKVRFWLITAAVVLAAVGIFAIATEYGTQSDPLVSLSYINDVLKPELLEEAKENAQSVAKQVSDRVAVYEERLNKKVDEFTDRNSAQIDDADIAKIVEDIQLPSEKQSAPFASIALKLGDKLTLASGCEILLVSGSAKCSGSIIDMTTGQTAGALSVNHLYVVPDGGVTISATAAATVLVRGQYSVY